MAQRIKLNKALTTPTILVSRMNSVLVLEFSFVHNKKNIEFQQIYPIIVPVLPTAFFTVNLNSVLYPSSVQSGKNICICGFLY